MRMTPDASLTAFFNAYTGVFNQYLETTVAGLTAADNLAEAIRYSLLNGGKRMRPMLLLATIEATGGDARTGLAAAAAIEMIHCYSLIHDDLPAMDNDQLRRGKPTCHIVYGEASAILAGDGLQAMAFELLSEAASYSPAQRTELIRILAKASGPSGMVGGQAIDLGAVGHSLDLTSLQHMHRLKTGALLEASVIMGAICNDIQEQAVTSGLRSYAEAAGLAFQIRDDIMDVEGETNTLGKTQGKDAADNKPTYTSLLGIDKAKEKTKELYDNCQQALTSVGLQESILSSFASFIVTRNK